MIALLHGVTAYAADPDGDELSAKQLSRMSLEDLATIQITSVSKQAEPLSDAAAAVYVITHDDIMRSGATSIPEMLRLAPNLEVAQVTSSSYAITARGFNGTLADKLLVLIDGRSVYTPLYGGVYWNVQQVPPEDIERIEVISGPGGTLWGANAVNGVINVITRKSRDTLGGLVDAGAGSAQSAGTVQYGGTAGGGVTYRVYGNGVAEKSLTNVGHSSPDDNWYRNQGGFRFDWSPAGDDVTLQGDAYSGFIENPLGASQMVAGNNLLSRWVRQLNGGSTLQVQAYYDDTRQFVADGGGGFRLNTSDLQVQHSFTAGSANAVVWGAGFRSVGYAITSVPALQFRPLTGTFNLGNLFAEDTISVTDSIKVIPGLKFEDDAYVGVEPLPSLRASWKITSTNMVWSSVSRAVRSPTPFDRDVAEFLGPILFLKGGPNFQSEKLTAYELGYRAEPMPRLSLSVSTFLNKYDDLRSIEVNPAGGVFPLQFGNKMEGDTYGVEAWATYGIYDWWRLSAGLNVLHETLRFAPGSTTVASIQTAAMQQARNDPDHQVSLRSSMNLPNNVTLDAELRQVGSLPNPAVPSYVELNARVGWQVMPSLELSLVGTNLLHPYHQEFATPAITEEVPRTLFASAKWTF